MARPERRDPDLERRWRALLARFQRSGQSVRAFCAAHGLRENNFYAWRRALAVRDREHTPAVRVEPAFVPVRVAAAAFIEVVLTSGIVVRVSSGAEPATVARLVAALGGRAVLTLGLTGRIWLCTMPVDGRKSYDGLAAVVTAHLQGDPLSGDLFVFKNRRGDRLKILAWQGDGFALYMRRLERGTFQFPSADAASVTIGATDLALILGIDLRSAKKRKRFARGAA